MKFNPHSMLVLDIFVDSSLYYTKVRLHKRRSNQISTNQATSPAHFGHIHALPLAESGTCSITEDVKAASMHQQHSGLLPVALAFSMAQTLGSPQMGQRVGSI
jgi:hypothetical protein